MNNSSKMDCLLVLPGTGGPFIGLNIEQSENNFNWSNQDAALIADVAHGLRTNAILLGTPAFYLTGQQLPDSTERPSRLPRFLKWGRLIPPHLLVYLTRFSTTAAICLDQASRLTTTINGRGLCTRP